MCSCAIGPGAQVPQQEGVTDENGLGVAFFFFLIIHSYDEERSGSVLDLKSKGGCFEPYQRHCVDTIHCLERTVHIGFESLLRTA